MPSKLTIERVRKEFQEIKYTLVSTVYVNSRQSFKYVCDKGHEGSMRIDHLRKGVRCSKCVGNRKLSIDFVRASFNDAGYVLLTDKYINSKSKLKYVCPKGHLGSVIWNNWLLGNRCMECSGKKRASFKKIKASFELEGYTLLSDKYINRNSKLISICPKGHVYKVSWENWNRNSSRCSKCYMAKIMPTIYEIRKSFESEEYILLSNEYKNARTKLKYKCSKGHYNSINWKDWSSGHRCPDCYFISISGDKNYNWKGGITFEPYCEAWKDKEYKQDIRNRDGNRCLNPYCNSKNPNDLTIHHINYDKKDCKPSNLITVCRSCNSKANKDRTWHKNWYQSILYKRYNIKERLSVV